MDERYAHITAVASKQFGAISVDEMDRLGVDRRVRSEWASRGLIERAGPRSYVIVGSADSWQRTLWTASADVEGFGFVAGRSGARLFGLDGFHSDAIELLVGRRHRGMRSTHRVCSTELELSRIDSVVVDGIRCLTPERLILDSPLFGFDRSEIENAIDSAIRMRLVSEQRLRTGVISRHRSGINGGRALLDALVDTGGESRLERWFLTLVRAGGLARPVIQQVWRDGQRTVARLDALFPGGLVVEIEGHGTHSTRQDRQRDEQRRTELILRGLRVITFTYDDVRYRPEWVLARLRDALRLAA